MRAILCMVDDLHKKFPEPATVTEYWTVAMAKDYRKRPKALHKRNIKKYFILPTCLLILNAIEEVGVYKSAVVTNPYLRTAVVLVMFIAGTALVSFVLAPVIEKMIARMYFSGRKHAGYLGEFFIVFSVILGLYVIYFLLYIRGPEYLLPPSWR